MCLSSMILFNMFSASYTSFLSVIRVASPFSSIPELAKTDYKIGAPPGSTYKTNFEALLRPLSTTLVANRWDDVESSAAAINKIKEEKFAYMEVMNMIRSLNDNLCSLEATQAILGLLEKSGDQCRIVQVGPNLFNGQMVLAWTKRFPYAGLFNYQ